MANAKHEFTRAGTHISPSAMRLRCSKRAGHVYVDKDNALSGSRTWKLAHELVREADGTEKNWPFAASVLIS